MEKNTKILIGVGAVIAAYLILKPKKVMAALPSELIPQQPILTDCKSAEKEEYYDLYSIASGRRYHSGIDLGRSSSEQESIRNSIKNANEKIDKLGLRNCYEEYMKKPYARPQ
jgi:hypothetical protein